MKKYLMVVFGLMDGLALLLGLYISGKQAFDSTLAISADTSEYGVDKLKLKPDITG